MYLCLKCGSVNALPSPPAVVHHSQCSGQGIGGGRVEFLSTSKDMRPHPFPHQSKFILKALIFKVLKYAGENTDMYNEKH